MTATIAPVLDRLTLWPCCPQQFVVGPTRTFDPEEVARNPNLSLYCVDFETKETLFVETPPDLAIAEAPFMHIAQRAAALNVVRMPWEVARQIANDARIDTRKITLIFSVGRCGSTFLSRAFAAFPDMSSLSEPDVMTQLTGKWGLAGIEDPANGKLLLDCTLLQCLSTKLTGATHWALKFQSYVTAICPLYARCMPNAKVVFLYRSLVPWMKSYIRMLGGGDLHAFYPNRKYVQFLGGFIPQLSGRTDVPLMELVLCNWLGLMEAAERLGASGHPMFLARYEQMSSAPHEMVQALSAFCELEDPDPAALEVAINEDSQAGTPFSQAALSRVRVSFSEDDLAILGNLLEKNARSIDAEAVLPGTFMPESG